MSLLISSLNQLRLVHLLISGSRERWALYPSEGTFWKSKSRERSPSVCLCLPGWAELLSPALLTWMQIQDSAPVNSLYLSSLFTVHLPGSCQQWHSLVCSAGESRHWVQMLLMGIHWGIQVTVPVSSVPFPQPCLFPCSQFSAIAPQR